MPRSSSRSCMSRGSMAVARSRTFSDGEAQNASWPTRRRVRSATDIDSALGTRWEASASASTAASPPMRRNSSRMTGPYSSQWPSASMTGWLRRARSRLASVGMSALLDLELRAAILRPARFGVGLTRGRLLTVGDERHAIGRHTVIAQILHDRHRPPLSEREVVLLGTALVAVALDHQEDIVLLEPRRVGIEDLRVAGTNHRLVEGEVHRADVRVRAELRRRGTRLRGGNG